ncbi:MULTISPECIES: 23S rRNA (guanosine(2251)-2'-O)-methyltransferase RlmB [Thermotoga]|uniref:RNA methyltransferase, TrmH family, group 3 n=3 Tax=Thermotoga petrophila TaxID=93929 RepID=A5ILI1_THEP1|nr:MULTISPECIES: 23S rRNA (guanosine(2251)-2'-O)-methyltransferase RlmB [Thermotoga]KUK23822.1 MAG: RNA methyltransferase, TrmH family, group 3 [Thermotoga petrophila]KUK33679.1 MAG: RNA methyltransferase, TrmH family, group 3 [Thermotoga sp. 47_83]MBZ4661556.1 methyltransferase, TrmH family, group 3 [Thermotoga sp.]ABQ47054.1 RNA methyltransferase, TrmH family, group 3 [Thermotoga petrophila RKU-1]ACB09430.1 RNA methyltransferase, TrmH family, group 3 [Thermotoga sp. RQ2]
MRVYGRKILEEALRNNVPIKKVFFQKMQNPGSYFLSLVEEVEKRGIKYSFESEEKLKNLSGTKKHQGVVFDIEEYRYSSVEEILEAKTPPLIVLLDQIQDPHNLGAIVRTSVGAGANGIIIPKDKSVKVTETVVKVSVGTVFRARIAVVTNLARTIEELKEKGVWTYASDIDGTPIYEEDFTFPTAFVFGNEGEGIRRLVREKCDRVVTIPMENDIDSLNVSVSVGVVLFEAVRQRRMKGAG